MCHNNVWNGHEMSIPDTARWPSSKRAILTESWSFIFWHMGAPAGEFIWVISELSMIYTIILI